MRIAFLVSQLTMGGGERQLVRTAAHLATQGGDVLVVSTNPGRQAIDAELAAPVPGLRFEVLDQPGHAARLRAARRAVRDAAPEVLVGWLKAGGPWAWAITESLPGTSLRLAERTRLGNYTRTWRTARLLMARRADRVVTNSRGAAREWRDALPALDVRVAPNFPPPRTDLLRWPNDEPVRLALIGRLVPAKAIPVALEALAIARTRGVALTLTVVGRDRDAGRTAARLRTLADELGVSPWVDWRPPDLSSLRQVRSFADVVVMSSIHEGSSNVVAEALGAGLPVVATEAVEPPWAGIEYATAPPGDAAALAQLLVDRAWEATSIAEGAWESWERAAGDAATEAWLG